MTTLAEKRKDAIKAHEAKTMAVLRDLGEVTAAMRVVGLGECAEKLEGFVTSLRYDLITLLTSASVNSSS